MRTSTGSISVTKIRDHQRRDQAVEHHRSDRRRRVARAAHPCLAIVFDQMRARDQRHRRGQHVLRRDGRRDERHVDGKGDDRDADDQHRVREEVEERAVLDHALGALAAQPRRARGRRRLRPGTVDGGRGSCHQY
jgi:hypothetical protein